MTGRSLPPPPAWDALLARPTALFLDVDGTLLEFADRPGDVAASPQLVDLLGRAAHRLGGALALLSGRPIADLDRIFAPLRAYAAGIHGVEVRGPDGTRRHEPDPRLVAHLRLRARQIAGTVPGVWVEDKGVGVALHHREAPDAHLALAQAAATLAVDLGGAFEVQPGVLVQELRPAGWDKGRALVELMAQDPFRGRRPVVVGDDRTDEHAFDAALARDGIAVIVGDRRPTLATYALADPAAARAWLGGLVPSGPAVRQDGASLAEEPP